MKYVDEDLAELGNATVFSKLDANRGFWQLPLDEESKLLTTFITPQGRFAFNRIHFGISSAPEIFTRTISQILEGVDGVICHMGDILVYASNETTHDERLSEVLGRLQDAGLTLNEKCEFNKTSIRFLGHIIDSSGEIENFDLEEALRVWVNSGLEVSSRAIMEFNNEYMDGLSKMCLTMSTWMDCPRCAGRYWRSHC